MFIRSNLQWLLRSNRDREPHRRLRIYNQVSKRPRAEEKDSDRQFRAQRHVSAVARCE